MPGKSVTTTSRSALLRTLEENPALPALIERLDTAELKHLIEHVGLEDAGAIVALTRPEQLARILDDVLWKSPRPGDEDRLSIEELVRWLELWNDIGPDFAAEKLIELGETFCAACFSRLVTVVESDVVATTADEFSAAFGTYVVRPQFEDEWDAVLAALVGLWSNAPDVLLAVLGQCCFHHSILEVNDAAPALHLTRLQADAAADRAASRTGKGFVLSADAGAFLGWARGTALNELQDTTTYDLTSARHFEALHESAAPEEQGEDERSVEEADAEADLDALEAALEAAEITRPSPRRLLAGPGERSATAALREALAALAEHAPRAFAARSAELAYLANVLLVGTTHNDQRFGEGAAASAVLATCNVGAELLARGRPGQPHTGIGLEALLGTEPGLVKAFAVGFHLLSRLPLSTARQLKDVFRAPHVRARYAAKPWVLDEVDALLDARFLDAIDRADFEDAKETVRVLAIALDDQACYCIRVLIDAFPTFPRALERAAPGDGLDQAARFIDSLADLKVLEAFLAGLARYAQL